MALTATLVESTANRLRYLITSSTAAGTTLTIANATLLTDLATDPSGPMRAIMRASVDGIGTIAAGTALTQAQARDIMNSDGTTSVGNNSVPRAVMTMSGRTGVAAWAVDANVDGGGLPIVNIVISAALVATAYLDIHVRHSTDL
jgi:hypothetical protein